MIRFSDIPAELTVRNELDVSLNIGGVYALKPKAEASVNLAGLREEIRFQLYRAICTAVKGKVLVVLTAGWTLPAEAAAAQVGAITKDVPVSSPAVVATLAAEAPAAPAIPAPAPVIPPVAPIAPVVPPAPPVSAPATTPASDPVAL